MDFFTKNKMLFWCVIVLVIVNIVTLSTVWSKKPYSTPPAGPGRLQDGQKIMQERLGLSPEQVAELGHIREDHFMRAQPLQDDMHRIRMHLLDEIFAPEPDEALIEELFSQLDTKQSEFERNLYRHFRELKELCTPEQTQELKVMLRDLIERTRPRDPQQRPRGPQGGRPPEDRLPPLPPQ